MALPLPGSIEDYELRARIERDVGRGRVMSDPDEARIAAEAATKLLDKLRPVPRVAIPFGALVGLYAAFKLASGDILIGGTMVVTSITMLIGVVLQSRLLMPRLERAKRLNEQVAQSDSP